MTATIIELSERYRSAFASGLERVTSRAQERKDFVRVGVDELDTAIRALNIDLQVREVPAQTISDFVRFVRDDIHVEIVKTGTEKSEALMLPFYTISMDPTGFRVEFAIGGGSGTSTGVRSNVMSIVIDSILTYVASPDVAEAFFNLSNGVVTRRKKKIVGS